jgi:hypothetical protein
MAKDHANTLFMCPVCAQRTRKHTFSCAVSAEGYGQGPCQHACAVSAHTEHANTLFMCGVC